MVLVRSARAVDRVGTGWVEHVDLATLGHGVEAPIDGRQTHCVAARAELFVKLLRRAESVDPLEHVAYRETLSRSTGAHSMTRSAAMTPTPHPNASSWMTDLSGSGSLWISGIRSVLAM